MDVCNGLGVSCGSLPLAAHSSLRVLSSLFLWWALPLSSASPFDALSHLINRETISANCTTTYSTTSKLRLATSRVSSQNGETPILFLLNGLAPRALGVEWHSLLQRYRSLSLIPSLPSLLTSPLARVRDLSMAPLPRLARLLLFSRTGATTCSKGAADMPMILRSSSSS